MSEQTSVVGRRDPLREAVMNAAEVHVAASGHGNLGVREIAYEAGCSSGMIYKLFASHDEIVPAIKHWASSQQNRHSYGLTVGSLDEVAEGRWTAPTSPGEGAQAFPPTITAGSARQDPGATLSLLVATPNGNEVPGVDLVVGLDASEMING